MGTAHLLEKLPFINRLSIAENTTNGNVLRHFLQLERLPLNLSRRIQDDGSKKPIVAMSISGKCLDIMREKMGFNT